LGDDTEQYVRIGDDTEQYVRVGDDTEQYLAFINPVTAMEVQDSKACFIYKSAYNIKCTRGEF